MPAGGGGDRERREGVSGDDFEDAKRRLYDKADKLVHDLPPPSEIPFILRASGMEYMEGVTNPVGDISRYSSEVDAALILGVWACDMSYMSLYGRAEEAMEYFNACQAMSDKIGLNTMIFADLAHRFRKNITNSDTISVVTNEFLERAEQSLEDLDEINIASMALAGSFVEGLYITSQSIDTYPQKVISDSGDKVMFLPLINVFLEEKVALLDLISMLKSIERDEKLTTVIEDLSILRLKYTELDSYMDEVESEPIVLENSPISEVVDEVSRIRKNIVSTGD